ncbi:hypothetical protein Tco_1514333 [Tanacetum coccineum]
MDVVVEEKTPVTETRVVDSSLKFRIVSNNEFVRRKPVKVNDTTSLKTGFRVVGRKKKPGVALQSPYEQQQSTTPPPTKR